MDRGGALTRIGPSPAGPRPCVGAEVVGPVAGRLRGMFVDHTGRLMVELATFLAAGSIMALLVVLGGEAVERMESAVAMTLTETDLERTRAATEVLTRSLEPNAPVTTPTPCLLSDGPYGIVEPCRR
jgi:hypothetical protein